MKSNGTENDASSRLRSKNSNSSIVSGINDGTNGTNGTNGITTQKSAEDSNSLLSSSVDSTAVTNSISLEHKQRHQTQPPPPKTYIQLNNNYTAGSIGSSASASATAQRQNQNLGESISPSLKEKSKACFTSSAFNRTKQHFKSPPPSSESVSQARLRANALSKCPSMPVQNHQNNYYGSDSNSSTTHNSLNSPPSYMSSSVSALPSPNHYYQQHRSVGTGTTGTGTTATRRSYSTNISNKSGEKESVVENTDEEIIKGEWKIVEVDDDDNASSTSSPPPCERSLHAGALWNDQLLIFGGYVKHEDTSYAFRHVVFLKIFFSLVTFYRLHRTKDMMAKIGEMISTHFI